MVYRQCISSRKDAGGVVSGREDAELFAFVPGIDSVPVDSDLDETALAGVLEQEAFDVVVVEAHRIAEYCLRVFADHPAAGKYAGRDAELVGAVSVIHDQFGVFAESVAAERLDHIDSDHERVPVSGTPGQTDFGREACSEECLRGDLQVAVFAVVEIEVETDIPFQFLSRDGGCERRDGQQKYWNRFADVHCGIR